MICTEYEGDLSTLILIGTSWPFVSVFFSCQWHDKGIVFLHCSVSTERLAQISNCWFDNMWHCSRANAVWTSLPGGCRLCSMGGAADICRFQSALSKHPFSASGFCRPCMTMLMKSLLACQWRAAISSFVLQFYRRWCLVRHWTGRDHRLQYWCSRNNSLEAITVCRSFPPPPPPLSGIVVGKAQPLLLLVFSRRHSATCGDLTVPVVSHLRFFSQQQWEPP